jgi:hypothetical protein
MPKARRIKDITRQHGAVAAPKETNEAMVYDIIVSHTETNGYVGGIADEIDGSFVSGSLTGDEAWAIATNGVKRINKGGE